MKKLILTYLTLPLILSGSVLSFNQEVQKINLVNEQKIAQAKKSCQWQVTKDRALAAAIVAAIIGGLYYKFGYKRNATSAAPASDLLAQPVQPNVQPAVQQLTVDEICFKVPEFPAELNPGKRGAELGTMVYNLEHANLNYLYAINQKVEQLKAANNMGFWGFVQAQFASAVGYVAGIGAMQKVVPVLVEPFEGAFGYLKPIDSFVKKHTRLNDARALVLKDSYFCKAHGYSAYYIQTLSNSINYTIDQLAYVIGYMNYCADSFKSQHNESAYQQAQAITQHVVEMTNNFAQQMNDVLVSENKSRLHDVTARYLDQLDAEVERFSELIYNS